MSKVSKVNRLASRIEAEGFVSLFPCIRCARLHKICIKAEGSDHCSECMRLNGSSKCVKPEMSFSKRDWKKLVAAQNKLKEEEEEAMMKILHLYKQ